MELSIRDWMTVIIVLLLLAVALDGYRRYLRERKNTVRLSRNAKRSQGYKAPIKEEEFTSELPSGPARVVVTNPQEVEEKLEKIVWKTKTKTKNLSPHQANSESALSIKEASVVAPAVLAVNDQSISANPTLEKPASDDSSLSFSDRDTLEVDAIQSDVEDISLHGEIETKRVEPRLPDESELSVPPQSAMEQGYPVSLDVAIEPIFSAETSVHTTVQTTEIERVPVEKVPEESVAIESAPIESKSSAVADIEEDHADPLFTERSSKNNNANIQPSLFEDHTDQEEIITLYVTSKDPYGFAGEDLLHILLACDCRFGAMNIFHRYESKNAQGQIQFSIVNVVEPGIFKLDDIKNFQTPGVCFFIRLPGPKDPNDAFKCMLETARCLVKNLDGELKDENQHLVTAKTLDAKRKRIRDFKKRKK